MTRVIQFNAPNLPNFGEANELYKLGMEYANKAVTQGKQTFDDAVKAVENRNHAQIQSMINGYSRDELLDPTVQFNIQEDIKRLGLDTGNIYDPMKVNTYLDTRPDTLLQRGGNEIDYANKVLNHSDKNLDFNNKVLNDQAYKTALGIDAIIGKRDPDSPEVRTAIQGFLRESGISNDPVLGGLIGKSVFDININEEKNIADLQGKHNTNRHKQVQTNVLEQMTPYQVAQSIANIGKTNAETDGIKANTHLTNVKADSTKIGDALKVAEHDRDKQTAQLNAIAKAVEPLKASAESLGFKDAVRNDGSINYPMIASNLDNKVNDLRKSLNDFSGTPANEKISFADWLTSKSATDMKERVQSELYDTAWNSALSAVERLRNPTDGSKGISDAEAMELMGYLTNKQWGDWKSTSQREITANVETAQAYINQSRKRMRAEKEENFRHEFSNQIRSMNAFLPANPKYPNIPPHLALLNDLMGGKEFTKHTYYPYLDDGLKQQMFSLNSLKMVEPEQPTIPKNQVYEDAKKIAPNTPTKQSINHTMLSPADLWENAPKVFGWK